jgi:hypothetical protein
MLALTRNSGVTATKTTLGGINSNFQDTVDELAWYQRAIETHPDVFLQVRTAADFAPAGPGRFGPGGQKPAHE